MDNTSSLFDPVTINSMALKNRLVRSGTHETMATEDGMVTDQLVKLYTKLSKGGVGLIVLGHSYVQEIGKAGPQQLGIFSDGHIAGLEVLVDEIHVNNAKVAIQIAHAGRQAMSTPEGEAPIAPSAMDGDPAPREMTVSEIHETIDAFGKAAYRAKKAGTDAIQLHAAHGYLMAQFLSSHTNRRTDEWGGTIDNKMRFMVSVYEEVRSTVGSDYPVLIKLNVEDYVENGITVDEACIFAQKLAEIGIDAIEISGGTSADTPFMICRGDIPIDILNEGLEGTELEQSEETLYAGKDTFELEEAYWLPHAERIKREIGSVPLILVGGMKYPQTMEKILNENKADLISMCRALIREPNLPNEMAGGRKNPVRCGYCNRCFIMAGQGPVRCYNLGT